MSKTELKLPKKDYRLVYGDLIERIINFRKQRLSLREISKKTNLCVQTISKLLTMFFPEYKNFAPYRPIGPRMTEEEYLEERRELFEKAVELRKKQKTLDDIAEELGISTLIVVKMFRIGFKEYLKYTKLKRKPRVEKSALVNKNRRLLSKQEKKLSELREKVDLDNLTQIEACIIYACREHRIIALHLIEQFNWIDKEELLKSIKIVEKCVFKINKAVSRSSRIAVALRLCEPSISLREASYMMKSIGYGVTIATIHSLERNIQELLDVAN